MNQQELRELENKCIQEHAPACTAACPIHVDVRGLAAAVQQGDFSGGLRILRKTLPFPGIISYICDHPCQISCKRSEVGDAISIAALEKSCVVWGGELESIKPLPPKSKRVAVVGGGLSGLTAAFDLARKGYRVSIYEAAHQMGGFLWDIDRARLPESVILKDLLALESLGINIFLETPVKEKCINSNDVSYIEILGQNDAVFLGINRQAADNLLLSQSSCENIEVDPVTYMTNLDGVFAFSSALPASSKSPIFSVMEGRRTATSIDRYLQKVSLQASRANEGPYTTRLFTSVQGIPPLSKVLPEDSVSGFTVDEAVLEAKRCILCECMECVKVCEYLNHYGGYPKKYVREIYNNLSIVMGTRYSNKLINSCSLCGLCAEICPENLDMGSVCKEARQVMVQQERMPASAHDFALRDMAFSNSEKFALFRNQPGTNASQYAFFPGCQLSASSPDYIKMLYEALCQMLPASPGLGVGLILRCCGAPADWAGQVDLFQQAQEEFLDNYAALGNPQLILACSSCYQIFKTQFPQVDIISLWEIIDKYGLLAGLLENRSPTPKPLAIHDPCSTRYEKQIQDSARSILGKLGQAVNELELSREKTECCSYGGQMWLANPDLAAKTVQRRISESQKDYVTYCAMCRDFFARHGKPSLHLLDLIFGKDLHSLARRIGPGYSQRHENRAHLKRSMLKGIWGEDMADGEKYENLLLSITPEVQEMLDQRLILIEDIQQVVDYAETKNKKLLNKKTGHFLAYFKPAAVTYWVEYAPQGEAFVIYKAYSHRMEIGEETIQ